MPAQNRFTIVLRATAQSMAGYVAVLILVMACIAYAAPEAGPPTVLITVYLLDLLVGLLIVRTPMTARRLRLSFRGALRRSWPQELVSANLAYAGMMPTFLLLSVRWFGGPAGPGDPLFWLALLISAIAGAIILFPLNVWLAGRGELAHLARPARPTGRSMIPAALISLAAVVLSLTLVGRVVSAAPWSSVLNDARRQAVEFLDLKEAIALYQQVAAEGGRTTSAQAELALAWLDWRVYQRTEEARQVMARIAEEESQLLDAHLTLAKLELEEGEYAAARTAARQGILVAATPPARKAAQLLLVQTTVEPALLSRFLPMRIETPPDRELTEVHDMLVQMVAAEPGALEPSRLLLGAALLMDDGEGALGAWRSYNWLAAGDHPQGLLAEPYAVLGAILPTWEGAGATPVDRDLLIQALADSRFYTEAAAVATDPAAPHQLSPEAAEVVAYAQFLHRLRERMDARYAAALRVDRSTPTKSLFAEELEALCLQVGCIEGRGVEGNEDLLLAKRWLRERFGAEWWFGRHFSADLLMGHLVVDEDITIEQYGESFTFRYASLDNLVSHGVRSWLFDQLYHMGGTIDVYTKMVIEFRPFRGRLLMDMAGRWTDGERRTAIESRIERGRRQEASLAAKDPYAYLSSLNDRLIQRSLEGLWAESGAQALPPAEGKLRFLQALSEVWLEGPCMAHEGRHLIDYYNGVRDNVQLEFTAKLAETAFSRYPGISLGHNILFPGRGIDGHADANTLVAQGMVEWMMLNADRIEALDGSRPLLPQLDQLTDEQLREAARWLDPLGS